MTPASALAHVFVEDLGAPRLSEADHWHLARVLRLEPGAAVTAGDGRGGWRACTLGTAVELAASGEIVVDPTATPALTVAFALVKGQRPELVVQKLTELGVDRIIPFVAERSVVRWEPAKAQRHAERFRAIAREAAMQCRRTTLPVVADVSDFPAVAALPGAVLADRSGTGLSLATPTVLIGPEGGWGPAERSAGLRSVRLAANVLRAETAALTAGALLGAMRSRLLEATIPPQVTDPHGP